MAIDIDGLAVLRAIVATPRTFPDAATEINNFARKLVSGQLKTTNLERLRDIYRAIGGEAFVLILDGQTDPASAALVKKLDKDNPDIKTAAPDWLRRRIAELASGASEPATKPAAREKAIAATLKAKTINLENARDLWLETGEASFTLVLAGLTEKQAVALAKKLDNDNPNLKNSPSDLVRQRIADLASGCAEPVFTSILDSKVMEAVRTRTPKPKKPPAPAHRTGKPRKSLRPRRSSD